jgi:hypothetical protein
MAAADLDAVEERLVRLLDRYRPELEDGAIYGVPSLVWPGARGHDYFVAVKRASRHVGLYLIIADRHPDDVALAPPRLRACRTGRATWSFTALDDALAADLADLLDRLLVRYRAEHS